MTWWGHGYLIIVVRCVKCSFWPDPELMTITVGRWKAKSTLPKLQGQCSSKPSRGLLEKEGRRSCKIRNKYSCPLNNTGLKCLSPLILEFSLINIQAAIHLPRFSIRNSTKCRLKIVFLNSWMQRADCMYCSIPSYIIKC